MRGLERLQLLRHLLFEDFRSTRCRDKSEERRRRVERARAEFWVRLQANEERVICNPEKLGGAGQGTRG